MWLLVAKTVKAAIFTLSLQKSLGLQAGGDVAKRKHVQGIVALCVLLIAHYFFFAVPWHLSYSEFFWMSSSVLHLVDELSEQTAEEWDASKKGNGAVLCVIGGTCFALGACLLAGARPSFLQKRSKEAAGDEHDHDEETT